MAGLRKLRGKYYVRVYLPGGKEKLIPTKTGDRKRAEAFRRQIEEREFLVKAKLAEEVNHITTTLNDAVDEYLRDCKNRLRASTTSSYQLALADLKSCWGDIDVRGITPKHLSTIREYLSARVNSTTTNIRLRSIRAFLNWLVSCEKIDHIPGKISLVKTENSLPKFFNPKELDRIFAKVNDPRLKAVFNLLAETGLRRNELFKCTLEGNYLHLRETKGRRERLVRIPPERIPDFILATEDPYHPDFISHAFTRAMKAAGVTLAGRSLHSLRHTFALREYHRTKDIYYVKGLLGHSSVTVTEIYMRFPEKYLEQVFGESDREPVTQAIQAAQGAGRNLAFQA